MTSSLRPPKLVVETREIATVDDLLSYTDPDSPLAWLRRGEGIVGIGTVGGFETGLPGALPGTAQPSPADWWRGLCADAQIDDPIGLHGTGLVAFGTLVFDPRSQTSSRLIIPQLVIGRRDGRSWMTRIRWSDTELPEPSAGPVPYGPYWSATLGPGALDPEGYQAAVRAGLDAIAAGEVDKVVLARDLEAQGKTVAADTERKSAGQLGRRLILQRDANVAELIAREDAHRFRAQQLPAVRRGTVVEDHLDEFHVVAGRRIDFGSNFRINDGGRH